MEYSSICLLQVPPGEHQLAPYAHGSNASLIIAVENCGIRNGKWPSRRVILLHDSFMGGTKVMTVTQGWIIVVLLILVIFSQWYLAGKR